MLGHLYQASLFVLYPLYTALIVASVELGNWIGRRARPADGTASDISTLVGAALGLLALLLAFSFSIALGRFDDRRHQVLEEANAIGSTANFALMLPASAQGPILALLRDYTQLRAGLGIPYDPVKMDSDVARSLELQSQLWKRAVAVTAADPGSLAAYRFVGSLNEMNNIHERRITALRYTVPGEVLALLLAVAMVAMGFTGYHAGMTGAQRRLPNLIMALTIAVLILMIIDLDRPNRGLVQVSVQPLLDAAAGIPRD
jgi:hypothetical protein